MRMETMWNSQTSSNYMAWCRCYEAACSILKHNVQPGANLSFWRIGIKHRLQLPMRDVALEGTSSTKNPAWLNSVGGAGKLGTSPVLQNGPLCKKTGLQDVSIHSYVCLHHPHASPLLSFDKLEQACRQIRQGHASCCRNFEIYFWFTQVRGDSKNILVFCLPCRPRAS